MASSNPTTSKMTVDEEALDPVLASIRKVEAIRDFATDITPLRSDGFNLHSWVGEIDKTLSDLIDRERYLRACPPEPLIKSEDKIARNLIYWTIPRELRSLINDTSTAHDAYKALQSQFLRNTRTSHMASLVDLFNFQMDVTEPHHITMVYDQMYKGMNELVASGFVINEDTLLGALFQIAVGRANSQLYTATSYLLDTKFANDQQSITSHEVCAAARRQLEHWKNTIFDEGPMASSNEMVDSSEHQVDEEVHHHHHQHMPLSSTDRAEHVIPTSTNLANAPQPAGDPTMAEQLRAAAAAGSSYSLAEPAANPVQPAEPSGALNPGATGPEGEKHQARREKASEQPSQAASSERGSLPNVSELLKPTAAPTTGAGFFSFNAAPPASGPSPGGLFGAPKPTASGSSPGGVFAAAPKAPPSGGLFGSAKPSLPSSTTSAAPLNVFGSSKPASPAQPAPSTKPERK